MFGQQQNRPGFGGTFGSTTPFGGTNTFGTSGGFGTSTPSASSSLFGSSSNTSTPATGGLFGSTAGGFTQNQPATGFNFGGQLQQQGQQQNTQAGTLFGTQTNTSLFSTPTTNSAFGTKTPGGFGATTQSGGGLFGSSNANTSSLFGTSTTQSGAVAGSMFGTTASGFNTGQNTMTGTVVKYTPPGGQDTMLKGGVSTSITTRHQCITAMKEYENKSLEELRMEDYAANRKGPQAGGTTAVTGLFGATSTQQTSQPQSGFGLFGQSQQTQNKTSFGGFGTSTSTSGGLFGGTQQPQQQSTGLFGGTTQNKPLFGTATTTAAAATGGFGFGQTSSSTSLFGQQPPQKPGGLFGTATTQSSGLFANPSAPVSSFGGFTGFSGTQAQPSTGLFASKPGGFGTQTSTAPTGFSFGQNAAPQTGGLFGQKPATSTSGFSFGQANTGTQQPSLFGNKPGGFGTLGTGFNTTTSVGGLGSTTTGGLFGQQNKGFTGGFAMTGPTATFNTGTAGVAAAAPTLGTIDANTTAQQLQLQQQLLALNHSPYGDSPLFRNLKQDEAKKEELTKPTNPAAQKAALNMSTQYKVNNRPKAKIKPKPLHSIANGKAQLFEGLEEEETSTFGNDTFQPRRSVKKLVIKNEGNRSLNRSQLSSSASRAESESGTDDLVAPSPIVHTETRNGVPEHESLSSLRTSTEKKGSESVPPRPDFTQTQKSPPPLDTTITELNMRNRLRTALEESRFDSSGEQETFDNYSDTSSNTAAHPAGIILRRPGYYTMPSLEELSEVTDEDGSCYVENFVVGREGYGNVLFPGEVNIANLNLDDIVHFRRKEITIYPDDDHKPPVGRGLNRTAQVTLDCVWPTDKTTHSPIKELRRLQDMAYQEKLERASSRIKAKFIDYRPESGSWVFEVKHFSKYGLVDTDDEDEVVEKDPEELKLLQEQQQKKQQQQQQKNKLAAQKQLQQADQGGVQNGSLSVDKQQGLDGKPNCSQGLQPGSMGSPRAMDTVMMQEDDSDMQDILTEKMPPSPLAMDEYSEGGVEPEFIPSSHRLARRLGVREEELQIRKASFFGDEEEEEPEDGPQFGAKATFPGLGRFGQTPLQSVLSSPMSKQKSAFSPDRALWNNSVMHSQQFSPNKPLSPFRSAFIEPVKTGLNRSIPGMQEHTLIPSGIPELEKTRKVVGSRVQRTIPTLKESLLCEKERCISDMGLFQGRKFRVGWGSHWTMTHCGKPLLQQEEEDDEEKGSSRFSLLPNPGTTTKRRLDASAFELCLERVHTAPHMVFHDPKTSNLIQQCLETQLEHSEIHLDTRCPVFTPHRGVAGLHAYASVLEKHCNSSSADSTHPDSNYWRQMSAVFDLCVALWGNIPELAIEEDSDRTSYQYHMARREALSRWLHQVSAQKIEENIDIVKSKGMSEVHAVFNHLTGRQISEACRLAQESGDHRLALLMAQSVGTEMVRHMIQNQLNNWEQTKADQFIDPAYLKVYTLLAGHLLWPASHMTINTCDNLDWKRCLALHLWYKCAPHATIGDALHHYNKAFTQETSDHMSEERATQGPYAAVPLPPYLEHQGEVCSGSKVLDICYHLLYLYCDRTHELHLLLDPSTATPNSLDYRLSWHLGQTLRSLEYEHLSEYHFASLCCNYASQLESMGMWQWAVFVLLHLENQHQRETSVRELICRHVSLDKSEESQAKEHFICEKLHVPIQWLHEAKAMKARTENSPHEEAWHLLKAEKWNDSHTVLLTHVASDAVINEHFHYLKRLLLELGSPEHCSSIQDWAVGGKVFLDYINMIQTIGQLKQSEPSAFELDRLQPEVTSLAKRISHLPCPKARDRLCQSEMAKKVANVMKTLMAMQYPHTDISARLYASTIAQLPMPEDYALQELRQLTHSYMMEVANS